MSIEIKGINKQFGAFTALNDINLDVETGELLALLTLVVKTFVEWQAARTFQEN